MRSSRSGVKITIDERDNWMRKAKARRAAEMFPKAIDQTVWVGRRGKDAPWQANMIEKSIKVFSSDEVESARVDIKI